jgi:glycosyltransferase involved in cell wall biosynthesis
VNFDLSYIVATRNRLPFLKITLERLINELQSAEEIIVVDGNSTDGSKEYLQQLFEKGKIHQFISEPDKNQAHAWNKAMLMAKGTLIKKIIDDDVFCYEAIKKCKGYMLQNPQVDVLISNDLETSLSDHQKIQKRTRKPQFEKWRNGFVPSFTFSDVYLMIRRSSLSYIGLYNTSYTMMDWEYSLRISYLKANIAYYTGYTAINVSHPQTVTSLINRRLINEQSRRAEAFYEYSGDRADISYWSEFKILVGKTLNYNKGVSNNTENEQEVNDLTSVYDYLYDHLSKINETENYTFL